MYFPSRSSESISILSVSEFINLLKEKQSITNTLIWAVFEMVHAPFYWSFIYFQFPQFCIEIRNKSEFKTWHGSLWEHIKMWWISEAIVLFCFCFFMDSIYFIRISFIGLRVYLSGQSAWLAGTKPLVSPAAPHTIGNRGTCLNTSTKETEAGRSKVQGHFWHHSKFQVSLINMRTFIQIPNQLSSSTQATTTKQNKRKTSEKAWNMHPGRELVW